MPKQVSKAKADDPSGPVRLREQAELAARGLLEERGDRVLVVYENEAASLYHEGSRAQVRARRVALS